MRRILIVLLIAVGAALWIAWRGERVALTPAVLSEPEHERASAPRAEKPAPPTSRSEVAVPEGAEPAKPVEQVPLDDRAATRVEDPLFSAKYAGLTSAQLSAKLEELEPLYLTEFERVCDLRFAAGQYRVVDVTEMEGIDPSYDVLSEFDAQGVMTRARTVALPDKDPAHPTEGEPRMEHQIVSLPPEIYPDLYRQHAELEWLRTTIAAKPTTDEDPR
jgi:hypothetical protein